MVGAIRTAPGRIRGSRLASIVAIQTVVATVVAIVGSSRESLWRDEVASITVSERSIGAIIRLIERTDSNSGLYYLLLHYWMQPNASEGWGRAFSALFAVLTVPLTALLARHLFDARVAAIAGFILALNAFFLTYARELRGYSLALFLATLASLLFVLMVEKPSRVILVAYVLAGTLALYTNLFSMLMLFAHLLTIFVLPRTPARRALAAAQAGILLLLSPLVLLILGQGSAQLSWIPRPTIPTLPKIVGKAAFEIAAGPYRPIELNWATTPEWLLVLLYGLCVLGGIAALWRSRGDEERPRLPWCHVFTVAWFALPPLILLLVSFIKPLFVTRYFIECLPPFAILIAVFLASRRRSLLTVALVACLASTMLIAAARSEREAYKLEDLRAAAALVAQESRPGDAIGYAPAFSRLGFAYYLARSGKAPSDLPYDFALAPYGTPEETNMLFATERDETVVADELLTHQRVWEIGYPDAGGQWHPTAEPLLGAATVLLETRYRLILTRNFGQLTVRLYERR